MQQDVKLAGIIKPAVTSLGYELVGVEVINSLGKIVRVYIDKAEGVTLDDCAKASRQVASVLDVEDYIASAYNLEVSSPGVERPLFSVEHFKVQIGNRIKVKLFSPVSGRKNILGILRLVTDTSFSLEIDDAGEEVFEYEFSNVNKANLIETLV